MRISIISFTEKGMRLSRKIAENRRIGEAVLYSKCSPAKEACEEQGIQFVEQSLGRWADEQMKERNALLFIGACGIAVRAIAPGVADKLRDGPVLVMDEEGRYIIPILSGHMGGANEIAGQIALYTGAVPVITTATDLRKMFAADLFAKKNDLQIVNKDGIAKVSAKVLAGKEITVAIERGHISETAKIPERMRIVPYPADQETDILIGSGEGDSGEGHALLCLRPREYVIGIGCKKGKEKENIRDFILKHIETAGISEDQIFAAASIEQKKEEAGILGWCREAHIPFYTFTAKQLQELKGDFSSSVFVEERVGVDNVCERAALKACGKGGTLVYKKHAEDGMTIAIAKREWRVMFDES